MPKNHRRLARLLAGLMGGATLLQLGPCATPDAQAQFTSSLLQTAINGALSIVATAVTNQVYDVRN